MRSLTALHSSSPRRPILPHSLNLVVGLVVITVGALGVQSCVPDKQGNYTRKDAGGTIIPADLSYLDIGTRCTYDPTHPDINPTNTCAKAGLTCVIDTSDGVYQQYGHFIYEAIPLFARPMPDGHDEGICTLVAQPGQLLTCPAGTAAVKLSTGQSICMRACGSSSDCDREGYVCDQPFMNASTYDPNTGAVAPLAQKFCVPACTTDLPYCMRSFMLPDANGNDMLLISSYDLAGYRMCEPLTGLCGDVTTRGGKFIGDQCTHSDECGDNLLCIGGLLYGAPEDYGFCAQQCNPAGTTAETTGCAPGLSCEFFLDVAYCFPDCINNVCGGANQVCAYADPNAAGLRDGQEWRAAHCIPCELSSLPCASHVIDAGVNDAGESDTGVSEDAAGSDDAN